MYTQILGLLNLETPAEIETFLQDTLIKLGLPVHGSGSSYAFIAENFEQRSEEICDVHNAADYKLLSALFTVAHYKTYQENLYPLAATTELKLEQTRIVGEILATQAQETIDKKFGKDYAQKNPHVFSNILNTFRCVYMSMQDKK